MQVADLIEKAAKTLGSQAKLARAIGAQPSHVSEWKAGTRPCPEDKLLLIARTCERDPMGTVMEVIRARLGKLVTMSLAGVAVIISSFGAGDAAARTAGRLVPTSDNV